MNEVCDRQIRFFTSNGYVEIHKCVRRPKGHTMPHLYRRLERVKTGIAIANQVNAED